MVELDLVVVESQGVEDVLLSSSSSLLLKRFFEV